MEYPFSEKRDAKFFKQIVVNLLAPPVQAKIRGVKEAISTRCNRSSYLLFSPVLVFNNMM